MRAIKSWTFILYPESATEDWRLGLEASKKGFVISPLHDKDTDEEGNLKKAHFHIVICDARGMSFSTADKISKRIGGIRPQAVISEKGIEKYMTHEGNEKKYQYNATDIVYGNGLTSEVFVDDEDVDESSSLFLYIACKGFTEYSDLIDDLVADEDKKALFEAALSKAYAVQAYLRSVSLKVRTDSHCADNDKKQKKESKGK